MIRALGHLALLASFFVIGYTVGVNRMKAANREPEDVLMPKIIELLEADRKPMCSLTIRARLRTDQHSAVVWRACKQAAGLGLIQENEAGQFLALRP